MSTPEELQPDELASLLKIPYLMERLRCSKCGHLNTLHNGHCCTFCTVDECDCEHADYHEYVEVE